MKNETRIIAEPGRQEIFIISEFEAPSDFVYRAHTEPELYVRWPGPKGYKMTPDQFELRTGGSYHFTQTNKERVSFAFRSFYHEVLPPERMIGTFEFDGLAGKAHAEMDTSSFESLPNGWCIPTIQGVYQSVEDRDSMIKGGM